MCNRKCPPTEFVITSPTDCLDKSGCNILSAESCSLSFVSKSCPFTCGSCNNCTDEWPACESLSCSALGPLVTKCRKTCGLCGYATGNSYYATNPPSEFHSCVQTGGTVAPGYVSLPSSIIGDMGCNGACGAEPVSSAQLPFVKGNVGPACQKYCLDKGYNMFSLSYPTPENGGTVQCSCCKQLSATCHRLENSECRGEAMFSGLPNTLRPNTNGEYLGYPIAGTFEEEGFLLGGEHRAAVYCTNGSSCLTAASTTIQENNANTATSSSGDESGISTALVIGIALGCVAILGLLLLATHVGNKSRHSGTFHCEHEELDDPSQSTIGVEGFPDMYFKPTPSVVKESIEVVANPVYIDAYQDVTPELAGDIEWDPEFERRDFQRSLTSDGPKISEEDVNKFVGHIDGESAHEPSLMVPDDGDPMSPTLAAGIYDGVFLDISEETHSNA